MLAAVLADLATGKTAGAEVVFLIALILAGIGTILYLMAKSVPAACVAAAVGLIAFGFLLL